MHKRDRYAAEPTPSGPAVLWKYTDEEGNSFYLEVKKPRIRSPFTGKSFAIRPERYTPAQVGQELKEERKTASLDLESYVDSLSGKTASLDPASLDLESYVDRLAAADDDDDGDDDEE